MTTLRLRRNLAAWLALAAMALNAAWPLLAHAKPAVQPEICTAGGSGHASGGTPPTPDKGFHASHCNLCPFGAERGAAIPVAVALLLLPVSAPAQRVAFSDAAPLYLALYPAAPPRGPPLLS